MGNPSRWGRFKQWLTYVWLPVLYWQFRLTHGDKFERMQCYLWEDGWEARDRGETKSKNPYNLGAAETGITWECDESCPRDPHDH